MYKCFFFYLGPFSSFGMEKGLWFYVFAVGFRIYWLIIIIRRHIFYLGPKWDVDRRDIFCKEGWGGGLVGGCFFFGCCWKRVINDMAHYYLVSHELREPSGCKYLCLDGTTGIYLYLQIISDRQDHEQPHPRYRTPSVP